MRAFIGEWGGVVVLVILVALAAVLDWTGHPKSSGWTGLAGFVGGVAALGWRCYRRGRD
jgi:hypothetical protein